jgi:mutator protein MutT
MKKIPVSGAIIIRKNKNDENELLLVRRSKTDHWGLIWEFPRGKVKPGEDVKKGLYREVKEETGLDVKIIKFIDKYKYIADNGTRESTQYNFLCKMINPKQEVKLSFEHDEYRWIRSVGEAELLVPSEMKKSISKVLNDENRIVSYDMENNTQKIEEIIDIQINNFFGEPINETILNN